MLSWGVQRRTSQHLTKEDLLVSRAVLIVLLALGSFGLIASSAGLEAALVEVTFSGPMPAGAGPWAVSAGTEIFWQIGPSDHLILGAGTNFTSGTGGGSIGYQHDLSSVDHVRLTLSSDYAAASERVVLSGALALSSNFNPGFLLGLRGGAVLVGSFAVERGDVSGFGLFPAFLLSLCISPEGSFAFFETARIGWPLPRLDGWLIPLSLTTSLAYATE